jgi:hypothetical protein
MQLIGNSHDNNNSANNELLVRNTANGEFYEWWIAASGALTGVNLGTAAEGSAADGIGAGAIVDSGSLVLANSTSGLANNSTGSANMPPAGGSTFASSAATSIDGEMPGAAASTDSTSLLVQSMASFGASEAIAASSSTLVGAGPAQSEIAAPTDPRFAHAT